MISRIEALYFKGMKYVDVELKPFNVLVGPNASGKSTLLDILTFLSDVLNDSPTTAVEKRCSQFRELVWNQERDYFEIAIELRLPELFNKKYKFARYEITLTQNEKSGIIIENEQLWLLRNQNDVTVNNRAATSGSTLPMFPHEPSAPKHIITQFKKNPVGWRKVVSKSSKGNDYFRSETTDWNITYRFGPQKASLARIPEDVVRFEISLWVKSMLMEGIQFLQLNSVVMRRPCRPDAPVIFEANGSNLPKVIKHLQEEHSDLFDRWVEHVKTALPDVEKIAIRERPEDRFLYILIQYRNQFPTPSWLLSDGTLRLLAQTIITYLPQRDKVYIIEEPENGLHPQAIEAAIQSLSSTYDNQVFLATHSPVVLRLSEPKDMLCFSKTDTGMVDVVRGDEHPKLKDWKKDVDLATLHGAGVLQ